MRRFSLMGKPHGWWWFLVEAEVRGWKLEIEQVLSPGEVQGTRWRGEASALLEEIGDVVGGKGAILQGVSEGASHGVLRVDVT
jgi:hypothetical protein